MKRCQRNDLCWCGSGKKYKKCHMDFDTQLLKYEEEGYTLPPVSALKNEETIAGIRKSGELTKMVLDMVASRIKAGVTTDEINSWVHEYTIQHGGTPATLNYKGYPKSTCTSINNIICHGIPDDTVLKDGDIINVDITTILNGFYSDASRMFKIGSVPDNAQKLVDIARECLLIGIDKIKPYSSLNEVGNAIDEHAQKHGFSVVRDFGGHGIGKQFHEFPHVDHYKRQGKGVLLLPGMVFTVEPMINEGSYECKILEDGWTAVTKDGSLSAQWEHTVVVTENGAEILV